MGQPRLLVDNFMNTRIYPGHVLSAAENSTDAPLVGAARRSVYDAYQSTTPNLEAWLKSRCGVTRLADMVVVERGHNQAGKTVKVQCSDDDFTLSTQDAVNTLTPTTPGAGAIDDALGVRTNEGAWLKAFAPRAAADWRYDVPALGAGVRCLVPGLWIGLSWAPGPARLPFAPGITELVVEEMESDRGWLGRGKATPRRRGVLHFRFTSLFDAALADWHLLQYANGRPIWIVPDSAQAEQAFLAVRPKGDLGLLYEPETYGLYPSLDLPYIELDPAEI